MRFHYIAVHLESIADTARDVDFALRWGFGWSTGPFETWQAAGWKQVAEWVKADIDAGEALSKAPLPKWVFEGPVAKANGVHTPEGSWSPSKKQFVPRSRCRCIRSRSFVRRCWAKAPRLARPAARPYSKTTRCACGRSSQ